MRRRDFVLGVILGAQLFLPVNAFSQEQPVRKRMLTTFRSGGPQGWINFTHTNKKLNPSIGMRRVEFLSEGDLERLYEVNIKVNAQVVYRSDIKRDFWKIAQEYGDCEDFVLRKLHDLVTIHEFPRSCLSIATCWVENKQSHAVLVVHTSSGDYVLDNRHDRVKLWSNCPYRWGVLENHHGDPDNWTYIHSLNSI